MLPDRAQTLRDRWLHVNDHLIGVVDLMDGVAVRGVAGQRQMYKPVPNIVPKPHALLDWYRSIGLRRFYVADLDALMGRGQQRACLHGLIASMGPGESLHIDAGWSVANAQDQLDWMSTIASPNKMPQHETPPNEMKSSGKSLHWILASESAHASDDLTQFLRLAQDREPIGDFALGIDFRGGAFVGPSTLDQWMAAAESEAFQSAILLDVETVGCGGGPRPIQEAGAIRRHRSGWKWITGGGIQSPKQVEGLVAEGFSGCLVASALLP